MLHVAVFQSEIFNLLKILFQFKSYSILDAIIFLNRKNIDREVYVRFRAFLRSSVLFSFSNYQIWWFG